jgi:hypothetical protein
MMGGNVRYYAVLGSHRTIENPSGLTRRTDTNEGPLDESLRRDLTWSRSSEIYEWEHGEEMGPDLVEVSEEEAGRIIERFRVKWAGQD